MTSKTMRGANRCIMLALGFLFFATCALAQSEPPEEATTAAGEFLEKFKALLKSGMEFESYVSEGEPADSLMLGGAYGFYLIGGDKLDALIGGERVKSLLELYTWSFTVTLGGEARMELRVAEGEGGWTGMGFGDPLPAIEEARTRWPAERGYVHSVAHVPGMIKFVLIEKDDVILLYPGTKVTAKLFGVQRGGDGYYPALEQDQALQNLKNRSKDRGGRGEMQLD